MILSLLVANRPWRAQRGQEEEFRGDSQRSRQFLVRVVRYLAADAGIRQFLDIGTGLPTVNNTHQVAAFFAGMELIEPGVVPCPRWRPEPHDSGNVRDMDEFCALGRKPQVTGPAGPAPR